MDQITLGSVEASLRSIFHEGWDHLQQQTYQVLKGYVHNYAENNRKSELKDDKNIIRRNMKDQVWFIYSKAKPLISHLLDAMTLKHYTYQDSDYQINFMLILGFGSFDLHACLYKNKVNNYANYYLYFENPRVTSNAYLSYMTMFNNELVVSQKSLKLPEFDKIYQVTGLNPQIFCQYDLLIFFSEIVMYYEDSGLLGDVPLGHGVPVTLNQMISKFNAFIEQKNTQGLYQK